MRIERSIGPIDIDERGIIHTRYHEGVVVTEADANDEFALYEQVQAQYGGQILLLNDLRGRITADRGARRIYGQRRDPNAHVAFVFDSKLVEVALNFIARLHDRSGQRDMRAFPNYEDAYAWLETFTRPELTQPPGPYTLPPGFRV